MPGLDLDVVTIAKLHSLSTETDANAVQPAQTSHRIDIIQACGGKSFFEGGNILELGCGQGDMSSVLVAAVSSDNSTKGQGSVLAWDPASGTYGWYRPIGQGLPFTGSPITLAQAQANLISHPDLSSRLTFSLNTPIEFVLSPAVSTPYTHAVLAHSIFYFPAPSVLLETFQKLASYQPPIKYLCLAEYGLHASCLEQMPHVLAVLAQFAFESLRPTAEGQEDRAANIRLSVSPQMILDIAAQAGWELATDESGKAKQVEIVPKADLQDGRWETGTVVSDDWMEEVRQILGQNVKRELDWIEAVRDATRKAVETVKASGKTVQTMDVWCAVLTRRQ